MNTDTAGLDLGGKQNDLVFKIKALMALRTIIVSLLLIIIILFQVRFTSHPIISPVTSLIALTYLLTIFYALFLPAFKNLVTFAYFQICTDLLIETGIIFFTGGGYSPFSFMYILSIISASIILFRTGGFWTASLSSVLYALLTNLEIYGLIVPLYIYPISSIQNPGYVYYNLVLNIAAFYIVAFLSGYLAESLRKTGKELAVKSEDFIKLKTYHEVVVENMGSGLIAAGTDGKILSVNRAVTRITGYSFRELVDKNVFTLFKISQNERSTRSLINAPLRHELFFKQKNEKSVFLGITQSQFEGNNNFNGYIFVFQDLTGMKSMEAKVANSERQAAIGRVAAGIAHEIRNPLASLSGSIQVLKNRLELDNTDKKLMEIIIRETERLNGIISDFLQYATPKEAIKERFNLSEILRETILLLKNHQDINRRIHIKTSIPDTKFLVFADSKQIRQVLWNLCLNGIEAMEDGGALEISATDIRGNKGRICKVSIRDGGVGIAQEDLKKVYEPFFTTKADGTGLGLSTVFRIMGDNNGSVSLSSRPGEGTTASISFPMVS